ncbi:MAG: ArsR/SmtB family transcription factor [Acidobacteriota bacterium]
MVKYSEAALDATFSALSDPTRRRILARLARGPSSVMGLAEPFSVSLPAISKHLRVLERAGLLRQEKDGRVRRCRLVARPMKEAVRWIERYQRFWEQRFDALAEYLEKTNQEEDSSWRQKPRSSSSRFTSTAGSRRRERRSSGRGPTRKR